jgi:predicted nuclease of predicted toxin-antitoxin system
VLIDMNLSPEWCKVFASIGWTSYHWSDIGAPSAPDTELMSWAREEDCIVFTHDLDFGALLAASGAQKPSVIQMRCEDTNPTTMGVILTEALRVSKEELHSGALVTVDPRRTRIRILPLTKKKA